jgi:hypothetical protein
VRGSALSLSDSHYNISNIRVVTSTHSSGALFSWQTKTMLQRCVFYVPTG